MHTIDKIAVVKAGLVIDESGKENINILICDRHSNILERIIITDKDAHSLMAKLAYLTSLSKMSK
ncbi:MAG: hypothetical protein FWD15_03800 [Alphaproteobacteria bacterium]|nr:hypothetical protein [Alphaproteobacteria bacterium]